MIPYEETTTFERGYCDGPRTAKPRRYCRGALLMMLRSWQMVFFGFLAQLGVGGVMLGSEMTGTPENASAIMRLFLGGGILVVTAAAFLVTLPAIYLLYRGSYRLVATTIVILVGAVFLVGSIASPIVAVLPAFLFIGTVLSLRERANS